MKKQILLFVLLMTGALLYARETTVVREHTFRAGAQDSEISAREQALRQMKLQWLQEDIGMLMQSFTQVTGSEQGRTITQSFSRRMEAHAVGVVRAREIDTRWDGQTFWIKAELSADMEQIRNDLDALRREMQAELLAYTQASRRAIGVNQISDPRLTARGFRVYEDGVPLVRNDVRRLMSSNNQALNLYNRGINRRGPFILSCIFLGLGSIFLVADAFMDERDNLVWGLGLAYGGIGVVFGIIAIPMTISARRDIQHSVDMYNRGLSNVQTKKSNVELQFGVTQNGLGFVLNF